jgi:hypothetical protein
VTFPSKYRENSTAGRLMDLSNTNINHFLCLQISLCCHLIYSNLHMITYNTYIQYYIQYIHTILHTIHTYNTYIQYYIQYIHTILHTIHTYNTYIQYTHTLHTFNTYNTNIRRKTDVHLCSSIDC